MDKWPGWCISAADGHQSIFLIFSPFSSFFFLGNFSCLFAGLAGSEIDDFKKMPYLWRIHIRRALDRYPQAKTKMSRMRQHEKLEKRNIPCSYWGEAALLLQRLWFVFFRAVNSILKNSFFSFSSIRLGDLLFEAKGNLCCFYDDENFPCRLSVQF